MKSKSTSLALFFKEKPTKVLLTIFESKHALYASSLAKKIRYTYTYINEVLHAMEQSGIIVFEKHGRLKLLVLTQKGKKIAEEVQRILLNQ